MSGYRNNPDGYGNNTHNKNGDGRRGYSEGYGSSSRTATPSYAAADAMTYMAARAAANQAAYADAFPSSGRNSTNNGQTYSDAYSPGSAAARGYGYGNCPSNPSNPGRTTWHSDPPSADALRGAADLATTAARRARNPNGYIPGGGNGGNPGSGHIGGWRGPNGQTPGGLMGSGWPGGIDGRHGANGYSGRDAGNEHGTSNQWGHGGYNGNQWGHGGSGNGQHPEV